MANYDFAEGQIWMNSLGSITEILAVDTVMAGDHPLKVIAFRFEGQSTVHLREVDGVRNWKLLGDV